MRTSNMPVYWPLIILVYMVLLGTYPFFTPDEGRYVELAREMVVRGDYIIPHLNGLPYFEKPPLYYWLMALPLSLFGPHPFAMRFWACIFGLVGARLTQIVCENLYNARVARTAVWVQSTAFLYFAMSHVITLDTPLSFFLMCSLYSFVWALHSQKKCWFLVAYSCAGLAMMTKGLIGLVFPMMIIGLWVLRYQQWRLLLNMHLLPGLAIMALIVTPWMVLAQQYYDGFFDFFIIEHHFRRYATDSAGRHMAFSAYIALIMLGLFPWTFWLYRGLKKSLFASDPYQVFWGIWALCIPFFFAFSNSVLVPYLLPMIAPMAIIIALAMDACWDDPVPKAIAWGTSLLTSLLAMGFVVAPYLRSLEGGAFGELMIQVLGLVFLVMGVGLFYRRSITTGAFVKRVFLFCMPLYLVMQCVLPVVNTRSVVQLAPAIQAALEVHPETELVSYDEYFQDLPVYAGRTVTIVTWKNELTLGLKLVPEAKQWMIERPEFWTRWASGRKILAVVDREWYDAEFGRAPGCVLARTVEKVLVSNEKVCE